MSIEIKLTSNTLHKKRCECGFLVFARSSNAAGDGIREHCAYVAENAEVAYKCQALNAKNV